MKQILPLVLIILAAFASFYSAFAAGYPTCVKGSTTTTVGYTCTAAKYFSWRLAYLNVNPINGARNEVWQDLTTGTHWSFSIGSRSYNQVFPQTMQSACLTSRELADARVAIGSNSFEVPSKPDYEIANAHGIRQVMNMLNSRNNNWWTNSKYTESGSGTGGGRERIWLFNGQYGFFLDAQYVLYPDTQNAELRCVSVTNN